MRRLALVIGLMGLVGCATLEFAPDAIVSSSSGGEVAVRTWEFCGPTDAGYECLDSLPGDDLPVLTVPSGGSWTIDRPAGYAWEIWYRVEAFEDSTVVMSVETQTKARITGIPEPGRYRVDMRGRTDETVGAWTFELVIDD